MPTGLKNYEPLYFVSPSGEMKKFCDEILEMEISSETVDDDKEAQRKLFLHPIEFELTGTFTLLYKPDRKRVLSWKKKLQMRRMRHSKRW